MVHVNELNVQKKEQEQGEGNLFCPTHRLEEGEMLKEVCHDSEGSRSSLRGVECLAAIKCNTGSDFQGLIQAGIDSMLVCWPLPYLCFYPNIVYVFVLQSAPTATGGNTRTVCTSICFLDQARTSNRNAELLGGGKTQQSYQLCCFKEGVFVLKFRYW